MRSAATFFLLVASVICAAQAVSAADDTMTTIFKCKLDGVTTFSDRPCGEQPQSQVLDSAAINTYAPPPASTSAMPQEAPSVRSKASRNDLNEAKRKESCARYARGLKEIRSKLRSGYTAKEGERLRARSEKLKDSQRRDRCG
jgi:hypothetical protein